MPEPGRLGPDTRIVHDPSLRVDRGRGYRRIGPTHIEVSDLDLAAWFHLQGMSVVEVLTNGREFAITFLDPEAEDQIPKLAVTWLNSEACQFSGALRQLKKVALSSRRR